MGVDLITHDVPFKPKNLKEFIKEIRRYKQKTLLQSSCFLSWEPFRNKKFKEDNKNNLRFINAYAPRIAMLTLAVGNDHRKLEADRGIDELGDGTGSTSPFI